MVSSSCRFVGIYCATIFFLSSEEVESFSLLKPSSRAINLGTTRIRSNNLLLVSSRERASVNNNAGRQYDAALFATPQVKFEQKLENTTSLNVTDNAALVDGLMLDQVELVDALSLLTTESSLSTTIEEPPTTSWQSKLLSVDVLGPIFSVLACMAFLFYTLVSSGNITDQFSTMDLSHKLTVLSKISWFPARTGEAQLVVGLVMAFSAFAQALTGFGFAVVAVGCMSSMPWLLHSELYEAITPVAATLGALVGFILLIPYAFAEPTEEEPGLEWEEILPLLIPCTILTPLGIQLNSMIDPLVGTRVLAALIMGFVAYKLVPTLKEAFSKEEKKDEEESAPEFLKSRPAAYVFGAAAGVFGGAFDVQGPPLCIYGDAKGWSPSQFRNNVLTVVALNSAFVVALDAFQGKLGDFYYAYFCITSLPGVLVGVVLGQIVSKRIDPVLFKNIVLVMCLGLGIQLLTVS